MNILLISSIIGIIIGIIVVYFIYKKKPTPKQKSIPKKTVSPKTPAPSKPTQTPKTPTKPMPSKPTPTPSKPTPTPSGYDWEEDLIYSEINQIQLYDWTLYNNKETVKTEMDNDKLYRN